ncbi:MAG: hypothetical protein PUB87_02030 [Eubacteriaceae bacterium]|nr:hypothetical protein [Eubacteriaceae bacterium]
MNRKQLIIGCLLAFLLKPLIDAILPGTMGNGNLILCLTTVAAFLTDDYPFVVSIGALFTLLDDAVYGLYCGPKTLGLVVVCIAIIVAKFFFNHENIINAVGVLAVSAWLALTVEWIVYYLIGTPYSYLYALKSLPGNMVINVLIGIVIYYVLLNRIKRNRTDRYY